MKDTINKVGPIDWRKKRKRAIEVIVQICKESPISLKTGSVLRITSNCLTTFPLTLMEEFHFPFIMEV